MAKTEHHGEVRLAGFKPPVRIGSATHLKVQRLNPRAILPAYQSAGAACFDLHACFELDSDPVLVGLGNPGIFRTGLAFEVPPGWVMQVYSRSGHGFKSDVRLANVVGIIDSDYRGEMLVKLTRDEWNGTDFVVRHGDRIAQCLLQPAPQWQLVEVDELSSTERGSGGFGSTGR